LSAALDRPAALSPGHGQVDLFGYATLDRIGAGLDAEARLTRGLSAYAQAWAGAQRDDVWHKDVGAVGGLRWQW
jgi:hypothetical protein